MQCSNPTNSSEKPNILFICVDDLRPELKSFGVEYISSPNIDKLAEHGILFLNHYVNSPSCGPSRYTLLTGQYGPAGNNALFMRSKRISQGQEKVDPSMPEWFKAHGYTTVAVGKVSHHPGGRGGKDWDNNNMIEMPGAWDRQLLPVGEWQHPRGIMHGLAHGEIRKKPSDMDVFQSVEGDDSIYPDGIIVEEGLKQLKLLAGNSQKPFFLAVGILKPHLPFGAPKKYLDTYKNISLPPVKHPKKPEGKTTWHDSNEFMKYNRWGKDPNEDEAFAEEVRRHYAACVSYADAQVGKLIESLKETGAYENTIIILWGDHGWNLGEHAIWGKHNLFEEGIHSPLVIKYPNIASKGSKTRAIVETVDIYPTLCELSGIDIPGFVQGKSLKPILEKPNIPGHSAISYNGKATSVRTSTHRLIVHKDGHVELYDHTTAEKESINIATENPELVTELKAMIDARFQDSR
ncbi:sulfatase [Tamlana sp. 2201CG12-4]|uniref:sulfatase n=1 Tax=Tamlana sp. 2201CG12-4 TaxID=3112582 RepID=UPI002DBB3DB2|nr:sulfatase [Tamlana sp. 2201CG12-4]MEC3908237.1 sulfatase [Tamlana sp. 2201CG12-4]